MERLKLGFGDLEMNIKTEEVSFGSNSIARLTLERPQALNALTTEMLSEMREVLESWESDPQISLVWIESSLDRAFCAGGDVKSIVMESRNGSLDFGKKFFTTEYGLDYYLHCYSKPVVCWASGITMGGGIGVASGCSHRLTTSVSTWAMPEVGIGFFPDVGAGYFLNQLEPGVGLFLGLTGTRINGELAVALGLANGLVKAEDKSSVFDILGAISSDAKNPKGQKSGEDFFQVVSASLNSVSSNSASMNHIQMNHIQTESQAQILELRKVGCLLDQIEEYDQGFEFLSAYQFENSQNQKGRDQLLNASGLVARIIWSHLKRCRNLSLSEVFDLEWSLAIRLSLEPDFREGVRSVLIDKDQSPKWRFSQKESVPIEELTRLLAPFSPHDLRARLGRRCRPRS
ncbi:MAG: enoyl-CoA hydratase/isomerase family protein [Bdellovibrionales bacterium]|nr:enoyl-CoA hydratase/isomerase family protein [Bdellovibrionales bacterium]